MIIIVGMVGFQSQMIVARSTHESWRWIKYGLSFICLMWAVIYGIVLVNFLRGVDDQNMVFFRSWVIRPMILITITLITASGIARRKS